MKTQSNKRGFTLIELMVVIVIIGILAAIAIPKLFGMTAKAKAAEVTPAATTWGKLQVAYVLERNEVGSNVQIGYNPPEGAIFKYPAQPVTGEELNSRASWVAHNTTKLNDCPEGDNWIMADVAPSGSGIIIGTDSKVGNITMPENTCNGEEYEGEEKETAKETCLDNFNKEVAEKTKQKDACQALTPNFLIAINNIK